MGLLDYLQTKQASPAMLGSGGASKAAQALESLPYKRYVQEAIANGESPVSFEQWKMQRSKT